jgi:ribonuclease III
LKRIFNFFKKKSTLEKKLYTILGFYPKSLKIFQQALTHKSIKKNLATHNERLEFLGDAVIGVVVAELLYQEFPNEKEGFLTQMRSKIVSRKSLNRLAKEINLDSLVRYHRSASNHSIFGNALEALVGAIQVDRGYAVAEKFVFQKLIRPHVNLKLLVSEVASYKSKVLEWGQINKKSVVFNLTSSEGKDHEKQYTIELLVEAEKRYQGVGTSIKRAEEIASKIAYKEIIIS